MLGVELEYLIVHVDDLLSLLSKAEAVELYGLLIAECGFVIRDVTDPFRISKETQLGYITIKPDFAYHLIEISLPPRRNPSDLENLISSTIELLDRALIKLKLCRAPYSAYPNSSIYYDLVESDRLKDFLSYARSVKNNGDEVFSNPHYPALISSVQVHLNILSEDFFPLLPYLYEPEWMVIKLFSKSREFNKEAVGCARILFYQSTLGDEYYLKAVPQRIPASWDEYAEALSLTPVYSSSGSGTLPRDYSLIRPRDIGTVEFRSACSQEDIVSIMAVCAFRVLQLAYATLACEQRRKWNDSATRDTILKWAKCPLESIICGEFENAIETRLKLAISGVAKDWVRYLPDCLK